LKGQQRLAGMKERLQRLTGMRRRLAPISAVLLIASIFLPFYKTYGQLYPKGWVSLSEIVIPYLLFLPTIGFENATAYGAQLMYTAVMILLVVGGLLVILRGKLGALLGLAAMLITTLGSFAYLYSGDYALWSIVWMPSLMMGYYIGWLGAIVGLFAMPFKKIRRKSSEKEAVAQTVTAQGAKPSTKVPPTPPPMPSGVVVSPTITVTQTQTVMRMPPRPEEYARPLPKPMPPRPEEEGSWLKQVEEGKPAEIPQPKTREGVKRIAESERKRAEEAKPTEALKQALSEGAEDAKPKPSEGTETVEATRPGLTEETKLAEVEKPGPGETTPDDVVLAIDALKRRQESGTISAEALRAELGKLMFTDQSDKYWTIDFRTGKWVYHDGERWVDGTPPPTLRTETSPRYS
jgi:hypothetical protein